MIDGNSGGGAVLSVPEEYSTVYVYCSERLSLRLNESESYNEAPARFMFLYARQQTAVARGLAWPAHRFTRRQTAAARKHSLCFLVQFRSNCHAHRRTVHLQNGDVSVY